MTHGPRPAALLVVALAAAMGPVCADEVRFASGKVLEIEGHRREGDAIWLRLPGGGELAVPAAQVREIRREDGAVLLRPAPPPPPATEEPAAPTTPVPPALAAQVDDAASRHGVDPRLVRAVIQIESAWDPRAVSPAGAMGLMQLMPATARARGVEDPFDPAQNLEAGTAELAARLRENDGELSMALAAYNAGTGAVGRHEGIPPYQETLGYVQRVLDLYFAETAPQGPSR